MPLRVVERYWKPGPKMVTEIIALRDLEHCSNHNRQFQRYDKYWFRSDCHSFLKKWLLAIIAFSIIDKLNCVNDSLAYISYNDFVWQG